MKPEIIVALDIAESAGLSPLLARLPQDLAWFKIGLELFCKEGPHCLKPLQDQGKSIFLDLKLHDIPRTVERAVRGASAHGAHLLTLHASGGAAMMRAAVEAAREAGARRPRLLAVTVLTSLDERDLLDLGIQRNAAEQACHLAERAVESGIDGIVCSPREVAAIRKRIGKDALIVTPGIRLPDGDAGDQKRTGTPAQAMRDGATHLVIGRPILEAQDPSAAVRAIRADLDQTV